MLSILPNVAKESESAVEPSGKLRHIMINRLRHVYNLFCIVNAIFHTTLNINAKQHTNITLNYLPPRLISKTKPIMW